MTLKKLLPQLYYAMTTIKQKQTKAKQFLIPVPMLDYSVMLTPSVYIPLICMTILHKITTQHINSLIVKCIVANESFLYNG